MGKAKKGKRSNKEEDDDMFMDSDVDVDEQVIAPVKSKSKAKKNDKKKNNKDTDDVDDLTMDIDDDEELVVPVKNKSKAKNKKKNNIKEDDDDVSLDIDDEDVVAPVKSKSKAKNKKKNNIKDDDVDDLSVDIDDEELVVPVKAKSKAKNKKKNNKDFDDVDDLPVDIDDEEELVVPVKAKSKAKNKKKNIKDEIDDDMFVEDLSVDIEEEKEEELIAPVKSKSKGKNKKKNIKEDDDDVEDLPIDKEEEELVASVKSKLKVTDDKAMPVKENENDNIDDLLIDSEDDSVKNKSKKKDNKKKDKVSGDMNANKVNDNNEDDESGTVKTAAQKKKEKKEREKLKKMAQKKSEHAKKAEGGASKESSIEKTSKPVVDEVKKDAAVVVVDDGNVDDEEGGGKKKKKKGGKDDAKTNAKDSKKGPSKALLAQLLEERKRREEEEERLRREEEELERQAEAAEAARLAQLQLEQERKEKKKLKEKQRKERLKAEGKLLTDKQKQDRARAQQLLAESLKAQGLEVPEAGQKKPRTKLGTRLRPNKLKQQSSIEEKKLDVNIPDQVQLEIVDQKQQQQSIKEAEKKVDEVKDSWDAVSSEEEEEEEDKSEETVKAVTATNNGKITDVAGAKKNTESSDSGDSGSGSDSNSDSDNSDSDEEESIDEKLTDAEKKKERARLRIQNRRISADKKRTLDNLRAAVVCVLGHVDTGKTKILDKLRRTNVQDGEAGGITQQIGATNVPIEAIRESTKHVKGFADKEFKIPGLLIIDTPGHESFSNLRDRGSSLCDISVLVIDIMHGLEPQTIESIKLLRAKKCPFVVALNKIDRLYDWETMNRKDVQDIINAQGINTKLEFEKRSKEVIIQLAEQGLNAAIFYENPDPRTYVSLVPTSAITGEGMGNLLALLINACQGPLAKRLMYSDELQATVLEVKALPGLGTTIDCILVNGTLKEGDTMIVAGSDGPIVTQIRSLLMPQPLKELRVKNSYVEYREIKAAQGVKIAAKDLEKAIAGLNLAVAQKPDEIDLLKEEISKELSKALGNMKLVDRGVFVQASTLGALEALLDFLRSSKIPYAGIRIGPVVKKDVMKASIMLEHDSQYATILAFDVKIERDAQDLADTLGVKIFQADIIYHLFDKFTAYREELKQRRRDEHKHIAVFPCKLRVVPGCIFKTRDPIVIGVMVEAGIVKEGTPVCVIKKDAEKGAEIDKQRINLGVVSSIEINHKFVESARKGQEVCVKIEPIPGDAPKMFGRHFDETDMIISTISRESIDACKNYFRDDLLKSDWQLMVELKKLFEIL
ncbi:hypothetical protein HCN44_009720 [Aphidius gifuensis]|uniref:Eukaryotic translation initiation factor 5B n=1 Tax=Aphidius gifuensis TaxID=684658 RepID=A0A834Y5M8_APHGI|nr:eukaryotic translation initiation factor 5B [Aphidius gifuensis]KAF7998322.1 hypothetical protein HCN44_009720 [Aphidius gifuensis]